MHTYEELASVWKEAADLRSLFASLPEVFRTETLENGKEHYQQLQELLAEAAGQVAQMDISDPESFPDLTEYLLMLARTIPEIDEEVFDHRMNVVREYRTVLKALLAVPWAAEAAASWNPPARLLPHVGRKALERLRESMRLACAHKVLLREKYEPYLEGGRHEL